MAEPNSATQPQIKTEECDSIEERANALGVRLSEPIGILPSNFFTAPAREDLRYQSHALDVKALFRNEGLPVSMIEADGIAIPFIEDRDATWVGPTICFGAVLLSQDPNVIAVALNVLSNYIYDFFRGKEGRKNVRLSILIEKKKKRRTLKIDFEGSPEQVLNINEIIKDAFE